MLKDCKFWENRYVKLSKEGIEAKLMQRFRLFFQSINVPIYVLIYVGGDLL